MVILNTDLGLCFIKGELGKKVMKQSLSWWGDVTTDNVKETIERNKRVKSERLIQFRIVKDILDNAGIEYWIDYGTLLGAGGGPQNLDNVLSSESTLKERS
jgi:hypothetical protein